MSAGAPVVWLALSEGLVARYDEALSEAGVATVALPVTRRIAPDVAALKDALRAREHDVVLLTSANGVAFVDAAWARGWPAVCVGERTARAAREAGFDVVLVGSQGAEAIGQRLVSEMPAIERVLFLRGREARDAAPRMLRAAGRVVDEVVAYALDPHPGTGALLAGAPDPDAVLVGSPRAADLLFAALEGPDPRLDGVPFLALGATTARHLASLGVRDVRTSDRPGPDGVLALLA